MIPEQRNKLAEFLIEELPLFNLINEPTDQVEHHIHMKEMVPIKQRHSLSNPATQVIIEHKLNRTLMEGIVEAFNPPIVMVLEKKLSTGSTLTTEK